jgi:hypothetical protein
MGGEPRQERIPGAGERHLRFPAERPIPFFLFLIF